MSETCGYGLAWIGKCKAAPAPGGARCAKHAAEKCSSCGEPATHECEETGQFVCGAPLCDLCEHTTCEDGTNGGVGFFAVSKPPEGYKTHCRKDAQVYLPWYAREREEPAP